MPGLWSRVQRLQITLETCDLPASSVLGMGLTEVLFSVHKSYLLLSNSVLVF